MTATTLPPPASSISTFVALRRAAVTEWSRLWTVRASWLALLASLGTAVLMGTTFALDVEDELPIWVVGEYTLMMALLPLMVLVLLPVTSQYATGTIQSSLQWVPRRGVLLTARTCVLVAVGTLTGVLTALTADLTAAVLRRTAPDAGDLLSSLSDVALVVGSAALVTIGIATVVRSTAGTLTAVFLLLMVLPIMLPESGVPWLRTVGLHLPGMGLALLGSLGLDEEPARVLGVLAAWSVATTVAGAWLFTRRDAA